MKLEEIGAKLKDFGDKAVAGLEEVRKTMTETRTALEAKLAGTEKRVDDLSAQMRERPSTGTASGMGAVDWKRFNLAKAIFGSLESRKGGEKGWEKCGAEYERDAIRHVEKTMTVAVETSGGFMVPAVMMNDLIQPLRSKVPSFEIPGINRLTGLVGSPVKMPRQTNDVTGYWVSETGSPTRNDVTLDQIQMFPKKCGAETRLSRDLIKMSPTAADQVARRTVFESLLRVQDTAFWQGSGTAGQPSGLSVLAGNTVAFTNATNAEKLQKLDEMIEEVEADNGDTSGMVWVMHPRVWHNLRQIQKPEAANGATAYAGGRLLDNGNFTAGVPRTLLGYPVYLTTNITASTTSTLFLFDPTQTMRGEWDTIEIFVTDDGATLRSSDLVQVNGWGKVDYHVSQPNAVCTGTAFTY